ncbi:hypothetical protein BK634_11820 [Pseudomonas chlororaphis]|jgi:hypothetical protein|nr:hypothetical protein BK634_11820 [Pseudomonas chlororaphis]
MSTNKPQQTDADITLTLNPWQVHKVQQFRERYAQWAACTDGAQMQAMGRQVADLAIEVALSVESELGRVEAEQVAQG